jgi:hypothetical protein
MHVSNGSSAWASFTPAQDGTVIIDTGIVPLEMRYKIYNSAPQSTTADMNDGGNNNTMFSGVIYVQ